MFRNFRKASVVSVLVALTLLWSVAATAAATRTSVIVVFHDSVSDPAALARELGRAHGFSARHVYGAALKGFVATVPARAVSALSAHPRVVLVEPEVAERIVDGVVPTGVDRIEVDKNPTVQLVGPGGQVGLPVAVIDTGIGNHVDLNVLGRVSFSGGDGVDKNGHGTHVAGTIGAIGNTTGVVGVAPGAPVYGVQVCKPGGMCMSGDIVAGINHVAALKAEANDGSADGDPGINFASANFSISSSDTTKSCNASGQGVNATHTAICGLVSKGVVFAMAGGNDARKKDAYPEAFTVAAIADFDGKGGKAGSPTCRSDEDDTLANFSNWNVDIAAPGTCILSTWLDGGYNTISGTSMATPHVAGAVALYLHANAQAPATTASGVSSIESAIVGAALAQSHSCSYTNERGTGERLLFVNAAAFGGDGSCDVASIGGGNTAPVATDDAYSATEGVTLSVPAPGVLGNDVDADDNTLTAVLVSGVSNGSLTLNSDGSFSYESNVAGATTDSFSYKAYDGTAYSEPATVSITISPATAGASMHLGALTGSSQPSNRARWTATATATVHDSAHASIAGATVTGSWSGGASGEGSCTTDASGQCSVTATAHKNSSSATFTVTSISHSSYTYDATQNDSSDSVTVGSP
ncbi:MAG: S8 family serine peptidase [Chloroflexota bacterium]|nr:S8 family serine peptidase [Chloroflexota bacterium]